MSETGLTARPLRDKRILLGITGGIAAYKSCEILTFLQELGATVRVAMTEAATRFVTPLTFETLSEHEVYTDLFSPEGGLGTAHIRWARWPELILICPATANCIAKLATGLADDAVSLTVMASEAPVVICPAMNGRMYRSPAVKANIERLKSFGNAIVQPEVGELACGEFDEGRLAQSDHIIDAVTAQLLRTEELAGKRILVTAGPTQEPLDPVRMLTNRSTGKMGFSLAEAAYLLGAEVTLVTGATILEARSEIDTIRVTTAEQMKNAVAAHFPKSDALVMAAAVADYRPYAVSSKKVKKTGRALNLKLAPTEDILKEMGEMKEQQVLVGFALETDDLASNARKKLLSKNLDMIVVNDPTEPGAGFGLKTNRATLLDVHHHEERLPLLPKYDLAREIMKRVGDTIRARKRVLETA